MFHVSCFMKLYELTYLISLDISEEELKNLSQKVVGFIIEEEGTVKKIMEPLRKKFGYPIKKKGNAFLITLNFQLSPGKLKNLEKKLKSEAQIIRYMILTKKGSGEIPAPEKLIKPPALREKEKARETKETAKIIKPKKVELKEIDKKIEEILQE